MVIGKFVLEKVGKKLCWPIDIFVDNVMEHKEPPLGKEVCVHFCPDRIRDAGSYPIHTNFEWEECLKKWHHTYPSRITAKCLELCETSMKKLEVNWGSNNNPKEALISVPSGADGPESRDRKLHSIYLFHEIAEMSYHLPDVTFSNKAIYALLAGLRCPDRHFSSACAGALWAIINSSVSAVSKH